MQETFKIHNLTLVIKYGDITEEIADAIVNAANHSLLGGGGVDGAIHSIGGPEILKECMEIRRQMKLNGNDKGYATGEAVATGAGHLKAKYVIHAVGPIWEGGNHSEEGLLANAYRNALNLADTLECKSIAVPAISTGIYGFPKERAATIAFKTIMDCSKSFLSLQEVRLIAYSIKDYELLLNQWVNHHGYGN